MDDDDLHELFAGLGPISIKRLFGGKSIYHHGLIIALVIDGELLLKVDAQSAPDFIDVGCRQWSYTRQGKKPVAMPYWTIPDDAFEDPDLMTGWASRAYEAARRVE